MMTCPRSLVSYANYAVYATCVLDRSWNRVWNLLIVFTYTGHVTRWLNLTYAVGRASPFVDAEALNARHRSNQVCYASTSVPDLHGCGPPDCVDTASDRSQLTLSSATVAKPIATQNTPHTFAVLICARTCYPIPITRFLSRTTTHHPSRHLATSTTPLAGQETARDDFHPTEPELK